MKHHALALLAGTALLALAGCGPKAETRNAEAANAAGTGVPVAAEPVLSPAQAFANKAASSDAFEIATSKLALETSKSASIKSFAKMMVTAHEESTGRLKAAASAAVPVIVPDPILTAEQDAKLTALKAKTGSDFDTAYAAEQSAAHQATLDALRDYSANGDVASLKGFAGQMVPIVTAHLNMAKSLKP